jgi:hypothetical protein
MGRWNANLLGLAVVCVVIGAAGCFALTVVGAFMSVRIMDAAHTLMREGVIDLAKLDAIPDAEFLEIKGREGVERALGMGAVRAPGRAGEWLGLCGVICAAVLVWGARPVRRTQQRRRISGAIALVGVAVLACAALIWFQSLRFGVGVGKFTLPNWVFMDQHGVIDYVKWRESGVEPRPRTFDVSGTRTLASELHVWPKGVLAVAWVMCGVSGLVTLIFAGWIRVRENAERSGVR